jgi:hypothetical protein
LATILKNILLLMDTDEYLPPTLSSEDGKRSSFRNIVFSSEYCKVDKIQKCSISESNYTDVQGGKFNILGGHSISHSKHKKCICTCVLFRTVSEIELFHCTVHCTDEQYAISSHELQSALMLTMEFS